MVLLSRSYTVLKVSKGVRHNGSYCPEGQLQELGTMVLSSRSQTVLKVSYRSKAQWFYDREVKLS